MARKFLLVEANAAGGDLMERTLSRQFPQAEFVRCDQLPEAIRALEMGGVDAIVVHKAVGASGEEVIRELRAIDATLPIVMMSSIDRTASAREAGATFFHPYDAWITLGSALDRVMRDRP